MRKPDWQTDDGAVQIYCGDSTVLLTQFQEKSIDAVVTDPPWNMDYFKDDKKRWPEYKKWLHGFKTKCERIADGQVWFLSTKSIPYISHCFEGYTAFAAVKNFSQMTPKSLPNCWDIAFVKSTKYQGNGRNWFLCNTAGMIKERTAHPTPRTVDIMKYVIKMHGWESVMDPFMGSGTTALACIDLKRRFIGIELSEQYFEIAKSRVKAHLRGIPIQRKQVGGFGLDLRLDGDKYSIKQVNKAKK